MPRKRGSDRTASKSARRLFYGDKQKDKDESDSESMASLSDISADDSVDDPEYVPIVDDDTGDDGDNDGERASVSGVGDIAIAGPSGVGGSDMQQQQQQQRSGGKRPKGKERVKIGRSQVKGEWKEAKAKRLKAHGKEYESVRSGQKMRAKKVGAPCKDGCFDKIGGEGVQGIFDHFYSLGSYNKQSDYITRWVRPVPVKRKYTKKAVSTRVNYEYKVKVFCQEYTVCRNAFLSLHDITKHRLDLQMRRVRDAPSGTPAEDKRGKRPNVRKIMGEKLKCVHEHIQSLPTQTSHYTRAKAPHKRYLEGGGTIKTLFMRYTHWMHELHCDVEKVSLRFYTKIFTENYNIDFKPPRKDTCATCDNLKAEIQCYEAANKDPSPLRKKLKDHTDRATYVQGLLSAAHLKYGVSNDGYGHRIKNVAMDLQQTLPCPRTSTGMAYYLRKMWVYNFCIYDISEGKGSMFVWDEVTGGRGSDEVASCLMKWIGLREAQGVDGELGFDTLRIFCDNCAGQNKNINVILAALRLVHDSKLVRVEFVYMVSGHSFLPCDRAFGTIEKKIRQADAVSTPHEYAELIRTAITPHFETVLLERSDFLDIKSMAKLVTRRQTAVSFSKACQIVVTFRYKEGYFIKTNYDFADLNTNVCECRLMKRAGSYKRSLFNLAAGPLPQKYPTERLLHPRKIKDLDTLANFMYPKSRGWFEDLLRRQRALQNNGVPLSVPDNEDVGSDSENELLDYDDLIIPSSN